METTKEKDIYKTSRVMYTLEAAFEYFIAILISGTYLAKLTTSIGISDSMTAILSTLGSLAGSFQIISIFLSHHTPVKKWVVPLNAFTQFATALLYIIPFMAIDPDAMGIIFFIIIFAGQILKNICSPIKTNWFMSLVNPKTRGAYTAILQCVSLVGGMAFTLITGIIIDNFDKRNDLKGAFVVLTVMILVLALLQLITLLVSREKPQKIEKKDSPLSEIKLLSKNKRYRRLLIVNVIWAMATSISLPFYGTYQINELGFSMTLISILSTALMVVQLIATAFFGRFSMMHSSLTLLRIGYPVSVASYLVMVFTVRSNGLWMFIIYKVLTMLGGAAISVGGTITYQITHYKERTTALALNTILTGTISFFVTLISTTLFNYIKIEKNSQLFGMTIYAQQLLSAITVIIGIILVVYINTYFAKAINAVPDDADEDDDL